MYNKNLQIINDKYVPTYLSYCCVMDVAYYVPLHKSDERITEAIP